MKTLTNTQFYSAGLFLFVLAVLAAIGPTLFFTGKLAYVQRSDFTTSVSGVGEAKCSIAKYRSLGHVYTAIKGFHYYGGSGAHVGYVTTDTKLVPSGSTTQIGSEGYISYGSYVETVEDKENKVGWACQKAGGELTRL